MLAYAAKYASAYVDALGPERALKGDERTYQMDRRTATRRCARSTSKGH
jgi:delta-aminolevulinic acid dehydratase/porphobilinogen synthase